MSPEDRKAIDDFLSTRGATRCPTAFASPTTVLVSPADAAAHRERGLEPLQGKFAINYFRSKGPKQTRRKTITLPSCTPILLTEEEAKKIETARVSPAAREVIKTILRTGAITPEKAASKYWARSRSGWPERWTSTLGGHMRRINAVIELIGFKIPSARAGGGYYRIVRVGKEHHNDRSGPKR